MTDKRRFTFFHAPNTRSTGVLTLLEELGCAYDLHVLGIGQGQASGGEAQHGSEMLPDPGRLLPHRRWRAVGAAGGGADR